MTFGVEIVVVFLVVSCAGTWLWRRGWPNIPAGLKEVPGPSGWPLLGNLPQIDTTKVHTYFTQYMAEYGAMFSVSFPGAKMLVVNDVKLLKEVSSKIINRPFNIQGFLVYNNSGISFSSIEGSQPVVRTMFTDAMHAICRTGTSSEKLQIEETARFVGSLPIGSDIDVDETVNDSVARQFAMILTGVESNVAQAAAIIDYTTKLEKLFEGGLAFALTAVPFLRYVPGKFKRVCDSTEQAMKSVVNMLMDEASKSEDGLGVIKIFLQYQKKNNTENESITRITDDNVRGCIVNVISAGFVGLKSQILATILCILHNQDAQNKIHEEMAVVCTDGPPTDETMPSLPYLEATILESWRYNSLLTATLPHQTEDDVTIGDFHIPGGSSVFGNIWNIHHDENIWGDPWVFRPERWLDGKGKLLPSSHQLRESLLPFGTGIRYCKGKDFANVSLYRYISTLLYNVRLVPPADEQLPNCDPRTFKFGAALFVPEFRCRVEQKNKN